MKITNKILLKPVSDKGKCLDKYIGKDKKYMTVAAIVTTRRFGPSGSLKNKNMALEQVRAVMPKINSEIFFDLRGMF